LKDTPFLCTYLKSMVNSVCSCTVCDYLGEKLAYFFGITSPKYQYAISEMERVQKEEQEDLELEAAERSAETAFVERATG